MPSYNIWDLSLGRQGDWYSSNAEGANPLEALRRAATVASSSTTAFKDGHIVIVAAEKGGHGHAAIFRIRRRKPPEAVVDYIQEVVI